MTFLDAFASWLVALVLGVAGATTGLLALRRYVSRPMVGTTDGSDTDNTRDGSDTGGTRDGDDTPDGSTRWSQNVVLPSNDTTGGPYLDDPARAGWQESTAPTGTDERDGRDATDEAPPSEAPSRATGPVTVPAETVAAARRALDGGDVDEAVESAYRAVRDDLAARADLGAHRTPQEFTAACRAAFRDENLDAVATLVALYERTTDGETVGSDVVEAVLDRLTDGEERGDPDE